MPLPPRRSAWLLLRRLLGPLLLLLQALLHKLLIQSLQALLLLEELLPLLPLLFPLLLLV